MIETRVEPRSIGKVAVFQERMARMGKGVLKGGPGERRRMSLLFVTAKVVDLVVLFFDHGFGFEAEGWCECGRSATPVRLDSHIKLTSIHDQLGPAALHLLFIVIKLSIRVEGLSVVTPS